MIRPIAYTLLALSAGVACGDSNDPNPPAPIASSIFEIQSRITPTGSFVEVTGRVMAVSSTGDRIWISDALAAAAITGVEVYRGTNPSPLTLSVGDQVEVIGKVQEFGAGAGLTVTQVADSPEITVLAPATGVPTPLTGLNPSVITLDPVPGAAQNGEPYEGVLIQLTNLEVTGTAPFTLSDGSTSFVALDQITALTGVIGSCYSSVTGIWNYDVVTDDWVIVPIQAGLVAGGNCGGEEPAVR